MQELPISQKQMQELLKLASTEPGKELLSMLRQEKGTALKKALESGNYGEVKRQVSEFMKDPRAEALLRKLGR